MRLTLLMQRYLRLRHELSVAYGARPWPTQRIDRLADRIVATERLIATVIARGEGRVEEHRVDPPLPHSRVPCRPHG
ncbi:hypothetical protein [uncultured Piscinibacter sp.]|uniref:hypothetical protein n=1 Tax=uncultured Piscinibacter sp. TaxID=1131835 RepID=UPI00263851A5|nr:hypothetical protein [uncultured Piscinibacter sp.]